MFVCAKDMFYKAFGIKYSWEPKKINEVVQQTIEQRLCCVVHTCTLFGCGVFDEIANDVHTNFLTFCLIGLVPKPPCQVASPGEIRKPTTRSVAFLAAAPSNGLQWQRYANGSVAVATAAVGPSRYM